MTEEFQDSDILIPETASGDGKQIRHAIIKKKDKKTHEKKKSSVPINIREEFSGSSWVREYLQAHSFDEDAGEEEIVPPHVILDGRIAGKAAFSLCFGKGRTLKGRDLSEVRNSVLRMTGFIES